MPAKASTDVAHARPPSATDRSEEEERVLYGRQAELEQLCSLAAPVVVVTGASGVGKSVVLESCAALLARVDPERRILVGGYIQLEHAPGALQKALFQSLANALMRFEEEFPGTDWGRILLGALKRAADSQVEDMVKTGFAYVLGLVRARYGNEVADSIGKVLAQVGASMRDELAARIAAETQPDGLKAFRLLASEVCGLADSSMVLVLDRVETLSDSDIRLLMDLLEQLPPRVNLVVAHSERSLSDSERVRELLAIEPSRGREGSDTFVGHLQLQGLSKRDVSQWMADAGLADRSGVMSDVDHVHLVTGGYPLFVGAAVSALLQGRSLGSLTGRPAFKERIQANYRSSDANDQHYLMLLAAFVDPPDDEMLLAILGLSSDEWAVRERRLMDAHFLVSQVRGRPWFHELGRRTLWEDVLSSRQRERSAEIALAALADLEPGMGGRSLQNCMDLVALAAHAPEFVRSRENLRVVLDGGRDELALLAALLELAEDDSPVTHVALVARHARTRFGVSTNVLAILRSLRDKGIVALAESERDAVAGGAWGSFATRMAVIGRAALELDRALMPKLATWFYRDVVFPRIEPFHEARYGVGHVSATSMCASLHAADMKRERGADADFGRHGLILRPRLGAVSLHGAISFRSETDRDNAIARLSSLGSDLKLFGERAVIELMAPWPSPARLRVRRFVNAAELAFGGRFSEHAGPDPDTRPAQPSSLEEEMELLGRVTRTVRELSSMAERLALELEEPTGYLWSAAGSGLMVATLHGSARVERLDLNGIHSSFPTVLDLETVANLGEADSVGSINWRSDASPQDPVWRFLKDTRKRFEAFNRVQGWVPEDPLPDDADSLRRLLQDAHDQRMSDAHSLIEAGVCRPQPQTLGRRLFVVMARPSVTPGDFASQFGGLATASVPDDDNVVDLLIEDGQPDFGLGPEVFEKRFGSRWDFSSVNRSVSVLGEGLAQLLGLDRVRLPDSYYD